MAKSKGFRIPEPKKAKKLVKNQQQESFYPEQWAKASQEILEENKLFENI